MLIKTAIKNLIEPEITAAKNLNLPNVIKNFNHSDHRVTNLLLEKN